MERLKASIPPELARQIGNSTTADLPITCAALFSHLTDQTFFPHLINQLVDPGIATSSKDESVAADWKRDGNTAFVGSDFQKALSCYSKALRFYPLGSEAQHAHTVATILVNRAACLHKLGVLDAAERDCSRAVELRASYSKAWYRRSLVRSEQGRIHEAISDMEKALSLEHSIGGRKQAEKQLESFQARHQTCGEALLSIKNSADAREMRQLCPSLAETMWTADKGGGLRTAEDLIPGSLIMMEDPYAAVLLKVHRDTYCHFCFQKLPVGEVACDGCTVSVYCSETCRDSAAGSSWTDKDIEFAANSNWTTKIQRDSCRPSGSCSNDEQFSEQTAHRVEVAIKKALHGQHRHECGGASWSAVLPIEAVLAARVYMRSQHSDSAPSRDEQSVTSRHDLRLEYGKTARGPRDLCHHFDKVPVSEKLEMHVLSTVLAHCLQHCPWSCMITGTTADISVELILVMAQLRANSIAISEVTSVTSDVGATGSAVCTVDQNNIAQAVYLKGSMLNHSCDPNCHASFTSRCLFIHATRSIPAFTELEICYGAQVGEMGRSSRQKWLKERYSFTCSCIACSTSSFSDTVINALLCPKPGCSGVVIGHDVDDMGSELNRKPFRCLSCTSVVDRNRIHSLAGEHFQVFHRLEKLLDTDLEQAEFAVHERSALESLKQLQTLVHPCNKQLAQAHDILAKSYCVMDNPRAAMAHCLVSIKILELLYNGAHITLASERLKLASIALAITDTKCAKESLAIVKEILYAHYGSGYADHFSVVVNLQDLIDRSNYNK